MRPVAGWFDLMKMNIRKINENVIVINVCKTSNNYIYNSNIVYNIPTRLIIGRTRIVGWIDNIMSDMSANIDAGRGAFSVQTVAVVVVTRSL